VTFVPVQGWKKKGLSKFTFRQFFHVSGFRPRSGMKATVLRFWGKKKVCRNLRSSIFSREWLSPLLKDESHRFFFFLQSEKKKSFVEFAFKLFPREWLSSPLGDESHPRKNLLETEFYKFSFRKMVAFKVHYRYFVTIGTLPL
jgi:hypothetical protein